MPITFNPDLIIDNFAIYYNYNYDELTIYYNDKDHKGYQYNFNINHTIHIINNVNMQDTNITTKLEINGIYIKNISDKKFIHNNTGINVQDLVDCANKVIEYNIIEKIKIFK